MTEERIEIFTSIGILRNGTLRDTCMKYRIAGKLEIERTGIGGEGKPHCVRIATVMIVNGVTVIIIHHAGDIGIAVAHAKNY